MSGERLLYAEEALEILKKIRYSVYLLYWYESTSTDAEKISDEDCEKLGLDPRFCRPVRLCVLLKRVSS